MKKSLSLIVCLLLITTILGSNYQTTEVAIASEYEPIEILVIETEVIEEVEIEEVIEEPTNTYSEEDLYWMARIISAEARGESTEGQIAVGNVVMNRVNNEQFPNTIKDVIFQKNQFSPVTNGSVYNEPTELAFENAKRVLEGETVIGEEVLYFYHKNVSRGNWVRTREVVTQIGVHNFAK